VHIGGTVTVAQLIDWLRIPAASEFRCRLVGGRQPGPGGTRLNYTERTIAVLQAQTERLSRPPQPADPDSRDVHAMRTRSPRSADHSAGKRQRVGSNESSVGSPYASNGSIANTRNGPPREVGAP
jgi:hypothetical protein